MRTVAERAHRVLVRQPTATLSARELHRRLAGELGGPPPPLELLLHELHRRPDLFRVLEPWQGPWGALLPSRSGAPAGAGRRGAASPRARRRVSGPRNPSKGSEPSAAAALGIAGDVWVVPAHGSGPLDEEPDPAVRTLRASLLAVSRRVDEGSVTALTRWMAMVREARRVRRWIFRRRGVEAATA